MKRIKQIDRHTISVTPASFERAETTEFGIYFDFFLLPKCPLPSVSSKAIMPIFMLFIPLPGNSSQGSHVCLHTNEVLLSVCWLFK